MSFPDSIRNFSPYFLSVVLLHLAFSATAPVSAKVLSREDTGLTDKTAGEICAEALNKDQDNWDMRVAKDPFVTETSRRSFSIDLCRSAVGLPPVNQGKGSSNAPVSDRRLERASAEFICQNAFAKNSWNWERSGAWADVVAEAKRRGMTPEFCWKKLNPLEAEEASKSLADMATAPDGSDTDVASCWKTSHRNYLTREPEWASAKSILNTKACKKLDVRKVDSDGFPITIAIIPRGSHIWGWRQIVKESFDEGVNFSGHYTIALWSCGTQCLVGVIVDQLTGLWSNVPSAELDFDFRPDKALLVVNPDLSKYRGLVDDKIPDWLFRRFYVLKNGKFVLLRKDKGDLEYSNESAFASFPTLNVIRDSCNGAAAQCE